MRAVLRMVSWNLHGALVPGSPLGSSSGVPGYLAPLGSDLICLHEVEWAPIPPFAHDIWTMIKGDDIPELADTPWGSLVGARTGLEIQSRRSAFDDPCLRLLYGYIVMATIEVPPLGPLLAASVHAPARTMAGLLPILKQARDFDLSTVKHLALAD